jgi:arylsulfatase A-like enzyme
VTLSIAFTLRCRVAHLSLLFFSVLICLLTACGDQGPPPNVLILSLESVRRTIVVLMADHGEEFGDHGSVAHGHTLYDELVHVPLIIAGPGIPAGRKIAIPVQNIDVFPTLAALAFRGIVPTAQGTSLLPVMQARTPRTH